MEEKDDKDFQIPEIKIKNKRRISIFRRRKRLETRPFVREAKHKNFKRFLFKVFVAILIILAISLVLCAFRFWILPYFFEMRNGSIISPVEKSLQASDIQKLIEGSGLDVENIKFSKDQSTITFTFHREIEVILDSKKDIKSDLLLLKEIDNQMIQDNKRAIYIDLRYNKPIVKF